jgi:hypothetical protein
MIATEYLNFLIARFKSGMEMERDFEQDLRKFFSTVTKISSATQTAASKSNSDLINQFASHLGLTFLLEKADSSSVCYAESEEVSPEYRQSFSAMDLLDYLHAILERSAGEGAASLKEGIFSPPQLKQFWELVTIGRELRHRNQN